MNVTDQINKKIRNAQLKKMDRNNKLEPEVYQHEKNMYERYTLRTYGIICTRTFMYVFLLDLITRKSTLCTMCTSIS